MKTMNDGGDESAQSEERKTKEVTTWKLGIYTARGSLLLLLLLPEATLFAAVHNQ